MSERGGGRLTSFYAFVAVEGDLTDGHVAGFLRGGALVSSIGTRQEVRGHTLRLLDGVYITYRTQSRISNPGNLGFMGKGSR